MKTIQYKGTRYTIIWNNGVTIRIWSKKFNRGTLDLSFKDFPKHMQGRLQRSKTITHMKTVRPLFSDKDIEIPVDTPLSCDPSTETYWSM